MIDFKKNWTQFSERLNEIKIGQTTLLDISIKAALFMLLLVSTPILFSSDKSFNAADLNVGSIANQKVVAPFNFFILKTEKELESERATSIERVPYYFVYDDSTTQRVLQDLNRFLPTLLKSSQPDPSLEDISVEYLVKLLSDLRGQLMQGFQINISESNLRVIFDILNQPEKVSHLKIVISTAESYLRKGVINLELAAINRPFVHVLRNGVEEILLPDERLDLDGLQKIIENKLLEKFNVSTTVILNYLFAQIIKPNIQYDIDFTEKAVDSAIASISLTKDMVFENERIVDANERIDEAIYQKLYSLEMARKERDRSEGNWPDRLAFLARMMIVAAILMIAGFYLFTYRRKIFDDYKRMLLFVLIIFIQLLFAGIITGPLNWRSYLIPTTISSMLLSILLDAGVAFVGTVIIALILGGIQGGGYEIALLTLVSGMTAIYSVHNIRNRNHVFKAIVYISLAYLWVTLGLAALRYASLLEVIKTFTYNLLPNAVLSPFITFMVLGIFEKLFDITTDVTLLEFSDLNHPLQKKLAMEAPGTFHHAMVVGNLAEAAAKAINANALLARVGSYYHDIGKIEKPEYYLENQMDAENRHNQLSPNMSALILASHVKGGIEMAKKYGIPETIRNFIPEHHGTNIMTFFYDKALKQAESNGVVHESDFRYPGPKPQTKETGIVMLADAVEAAVKSIPNPNPNKIRQMVDTLIDQRFRDGELDECDLTLRDLKMIGDAFIPVLYGMLQRRIEYPDLEKTRQLVRQKSKSDKAVRNGNSNSPA